MEHREAGADLLREREQVELDAELAMVAPLGFLDALQILVERLLRFPRGAVDALVSCGLFSSPRQYAPLTAVSVNAPRRPVEGTCGPRQRSSQPSLR